MKRLKSKLLAMDPNTTTYQDIYEGGMTVHYSNGYPTAETVYENTYYASPETIPFPIGFRVERTHKLALDKPTVTIIIPAENILTETRGNTEQMKRLRHYLLHMENNTSTYQEMAERLTGISASTACADYCLRTFKPYVDELNTALYNRSRPDKENGKYYLHSPGGEVLTRNTAYFALCPQKDYENGHGNNVYFLDDGLPRPPKMCLCITMQVQLPARKIRKTIQMLCRDLPEAVENFIMNFDAAGLNAALILAEKQAAIRSWLKNSEYCAFIANGSILPRQKNTDLPLEEAIPFQSVPADEIEVSGVRGMGIRRGVTVITGGGYSGKSTLLNAISAGIYNHTAGDGRELVLTDDTAVTISAEDGRSVKNVNISPFIKWIPGGNPVDFSTEHASGSTSQAANIVEAVGYGTHLLLIDEDKSATNFMIRDKMMKELIEKEPITPFTDRVNELYRQCGVSTILVIGGSGEYLSAADKIYRMDDFMIHDATEVSKEICRRHGVTNEYPAPVDWICHRSLLSEGFTSYPEDSGTERLEISDMGFILIGNERVDIRMLHNIVSSEQLTALGFMLRYLEVTNNSLKIDMEARIDELYQKLEAEGLDSVYSGFFTTCQRFMEMPRKAELIAVLNRMRHIKFTRDF